MHHDGRVHRDLSAHLSLNVTSPATLAFELAVSTQLTARESWQVTLDGSPVEAAEATDVQLEALVGLLTDALREAAPLPAS